MKAYRFVWIVVLVFAGGTYGVTDAGWRSGESGLVARVGPQDGEMAGPALGADVLEPVLDAYSGPAPDPQKEVGASVSQRTGTDLESSGPLGSGLVNGFFTTEAGIGQHWSTDPGRHADASFVDASSRVHLPIFGETDRAPALLPTKGETFFMEVVVFPALALAALISIVAIVVVKIRRRRSRNRVYELLQV
jgi:hypothetical protein